MNVVIYTVSHPITKEVVYVGATKNIKKRRKEHRRKLGAHDNLKDYMTCLWNQGLFALVEEIDQVEEEFANDCETYWIHQLSCWGFNIINKVKTIRTKTPKLSTVRNRVKNIKVKKIKIQTIRTKRSVFKKQVIIEQFDLNGELVNTYLSYKDLEELGFKKQAVQIRSRYGWSIYKGFRWKVTTIKVLTTTH